MSFEITMIDKNAQLKNAEKFHTNDKFDMQHFTYLFRHWMCLQ